MASSDNKAVTNWESKSYIFMTVFNDNAEQSYSNWVLLMAYLNDTGYFLCAAHKLYVIKNNGGRETTITLHSSLPMAMSYHEWNINIKWDLIIHVFL